MNTHESAAKESTLAEESASPLRRFSFRIFPRDAWILTIPGAAVIAAASLVVIRMASGPMFFVFVAVALLVVVGIMARRRRNPVTVLEPLA